MAHTPGPWIPLECDGNADDLAIADNDGGYVCYSVATHADAELIAAAPELLAALKVIRDDLLALDSGDVGNGIDGWRHMDATLVDQLISGSFRVACDAIAEAEGRAE